MATIGKSFVMGLAYYTGNPTNVSTNVLNIPKGCLVLDMTNGVLYQKTSTTDNSTFVIIATASGTLTLPAIAGGLTASGSVANDFSGSTGTFLTSTGMTTISGGLKGSVQALAAAGAVNLTTLVTTIASAGAIALTLADGVSGQIKVISMITDGGDATLTVTNLQGGTTIVFGDIGDTATLIFVGTKWAAIGLTGVTIA